MPRGESFDERLLHWIAEHRVDTLDSISTTLMHLSETPWVLLVVAFVGLAVVIQQRAWRVGLAVGLASQLGGFASGQLKLHFERPRPTFPDALVQASGYAMPSSHASLTAAGAVALMLVVRWRSRRASVLAATVLALGLVLVGAAMVYLGAHWATDVAAGWVLGVPIGAMVGLIFKQRRPSRAPV